MQATLIDTIRGLSKRTGFKVLCTYGLQSTHKVGPKMHFSKVSELPTFHYTLLDKCRALLSVVERGVAKRSRLFTQLGTQHSKDVLFDE